MKEQIQKKLSDSKAARWTALIIVSFTMMCGYFLTDVMSPLENLLTTRGSVAYFTDDTSMPTDSLLAKMELLVADEASPSLTVESLEKGLQVQYLDCVDGNQQVVEQTVATIASGEGWSSTEYGFFSGSYGYINVFLLMLFFGGLILDKMGIRFTGILSSGLMFAGALIKWYALASDFGDATFLGMNLQVSWLRWASPFSVSAAKSVVLPYRRSLSNGLPVRNWLWPWDFRWRWPVSERL